MYACHTELVSPRCTSGGQYATRTNPDTALRSAKPVSPRYTSRGQYGTSFMIEAEHAPSAQHARPPRRRDFSKPQTARPNASVHKKPPPPRPAVPQATEADAKRHKIPAGYSLKNWDPTEEPIMLLGSVFDANSLGKWIYDWTVYHHGAGSPIGEMAGELWLLLIQLSGKIKRAKGTVRSTWPKEDREMVEELIEAGDGITNRLRKLLKACEVPMLRSRSKEEKEGQLGKSAGVEFVETLFGADRELDKTHRLMTSIRLWNLHFDTKLEEIIPH